MIRTQPFNRLRFFYVQIFNRFQGFSLDERVVCVLAFSFPIFFLTVKGWGNSIYFLILCTCVVSIAKDFSGYFKLSERITWLALGAMAIPFLTELIAQSGRFSFILSSFDSPSRFLGGGCILLYLLRSKITKEVFFLFCSGAWLGCAVTCLFFIANFELNQASRATTYFVDANNLGFNILLLTIFSVYLTYFKWTNNFQRVVLSLSIPMGIYVLLLTGSRASWIACVVAFEVFLVATLWRKKGLFLCVNLLMVSLMFLISQSSDFVNSRIIEMLAELQNVRGSFSPSSAGFRLNLLSIDIELLKQYPLFGVADGHVPPFLEMKRYIPDLELEVYNMFVVAGPHSEFIAQLVRKGIFLGSLTLVATIGFPLYFFAKHFSLPRPRSKAVALITVMALTTIVVTGSAIEVSNLKMNASFLSFILALAFSFFLAKGNGKPSVCEGSSRV